MSYASLVQTRVSLQDQRSSNSNGTYVAFVLMCLVAVFYSRIASTVGIPSVVDFIHYPMILYFSMMLMLRRQDAFSSSLLLCLFYMAGTMIVSALFNGAGFINLVLDFALISQPFVFLYILNSKAWSEQHLRMFRNFIMGFASVNVLFAFYQHLVQGQTNDGVRGVFLGMGAGAHVAGAVALSSIVYVFGSKQIKSKWLRYTFLILSLLVVVFCDNKQTLAVFLIGLFVLVVRRFYNPVVALKYTIIITSFCALLYVLADTLYPALWWWARWDYIQLGLHQKFSVFDIINSNHVSFMNTVIGLGPGHTVGRLGQLLPNYSSLLGGLGATISPVTEQVWISHQSNWMSNDVTGSSMWSLLFSWAGVYGDLGLAGTLIYIILWVLVYRKFCKTDMSKFLFFTIMIHGIVFQWMEEPGYMLFVISLIFLLGQEQGLLKYKRNSEVTE